MNRNRRGHIRGAKRDIKHTSLQSSVRIHDEEDLIRVSNKVRESSALYLVLDGVQDPHNLGACLRSCDGAGVAGVIIPKDKAVSVTDTVRNVACGAADNIPVYRVKNLADSIEEMKFAGFKIIGTEDETDKLIYDVDFTGDVCLVLGAEGAGIRKRTRDCCDVVAKIPMQGKVECLNVSVATGVCLYEALRQRNFK